MDAFFSIFRKNFAAAAIDATDQPPIKVNFGVSIGRVLFISSENRAAAAIDATDHPPILLEGLIYFKENRAAGAIDATDHPQIQFNFGV